MIVIPAVDLRAGQCVQLAGGAYDAVRVRLDDPPGIARDWTRLGFRWLHVVDLDAAMGRGANEGLVHDILRATDARVQVGGGVRDDAGVERLVAAGAERVIVGTRALEDPAWLERITTAFPGRLIVAADVRGRCVVTQGWARASTRDVADVVRELDALPLAGVLVTAVHREGQLEGTDLALMADVAATSAHAVLASGGITSIAELRSLAHLGAAGAIVGMALYTGRLDPRAVAEEFAA